MTTNIDIIDDNGYGLQNSNNFNYTGFVVVTNKTNSPIDVTVTPHATNGSSFGFGYWANGLAPSESLSVPVDADYPDLQIQIGSSVLSQTIVCLAGAPKVSGSGSIQTWESARCSGNVQVRNRTGGTVYVQIGGSVTGISDDEESFLVSLSETELSVGLDPQMSSPVDITIVHQDGATVLVSDPGSGDFEVDTQVLSAATNGQAATLEVQYSSSSPGGRKVVVEVIDFNGTVSSTSRAITPGQSTSVPVRAQDAYLAIGEPPSTGVAVRRERPVLPPDPQVDEHGLPALIGDPVVLIKHKGYASGG